MAILIFQRAILRDRETGDYVSYWPERVSLEQLAKEYADGSMASFSASYMLDAQAAAGRQLQRDWLQFYLPHELEDYRRLHATVRGSNHTGADLGAGGEAAHADFMAVCNIERIANRGFVTHFHMKRYNLDIQAQELEEQLNQIEPSFTIIEDTASHGYVYRDMTSGINDGAGSRHAFRIEKPQSKAAGGDKPTRFKAMAPRFARGQIMLPGREGPGGTALPTREIMPLVNQWTSFPGAHDDGLDALYWASYSAFGVEKPVSVSKSESGEITAHSPDPTTAKPSKSAICSDANHEGRGKPSDLCLNCAFNRELRGEVSGIDTLNPGAYNKARDIASHRPNFGMSTHRKLNLRR